MTLHIETGFVPQAFALILARTAAIIGGATVFGRTRVSPRIGAVLAFVIAMVLLPVAPAGWIEAAARLHGPGEMALAMLSEALIGFAIALVCDIIVGVCALAGFMIGFGSSLNMAQVIDPATGGQGEIVGGMLQLLCFVFFVTSDAHLVLIRFLGNSLSALPPYPAVWLTQDILTNLFTLAGKMFDWGVRFAAPAIAVALILDASLGLIARMAPDFDILFLSLPIRLVLGLAAFGIVVKYARPFLAWLCEVMLGGCYRVLCPV